MYLVDEEGLKELIKKILDETKCEDKDYEIVRIGHLALGYQTFIGREADKDEIEIYEWSKDFTSRWTIASFEYDEKEEVYNVVSCGDRLSRIDDWGAFGELVKTGYNILDSLV